MLIVVAIAIKHAILFYVISRELFYSFFDYNQQYILDLISNFDSYNFYIFRILQLTRIVFLALVQ